jgi:hypothetical protein
MSRQRAEAYEKQSAFMMNVEFCNLLEITFQLFRWFVFENYVLLKLNQKEIKSNNE